MGARKGNLFLSGMGDRGGEVRVGHVNHIGDDHLVCEVVILLSIVKSNIDDMRWGS